MNLTPYVASLRVYEPLESFDQDTQALWINLPTLSQTKRNESEGAIKRLVLFEHLHSLEPDAHCLDRDGKRFVSPWSIKIRSKVAMQAFRNSVPTSIFPFFIPADLENSIDVEIEFEDKVPHVISERWMIPPRWFSLFRPDERLFGCQDDQMFCTYRTEVAKAKERCVETHRIVRTAFGVGSVEAEISELLDWLNVFHENSLVELDYGGLATFVESSLLANGGGGLRDDNSVEDVMESLSGLASGDGVLAGEAYGRLVRRWRQIASFEQAQ